MKRRYTLLIALALCVLPWTAQQGLHDAVLLRPTAHPQTAPTIDAAAKSAGATDNWLAQVQRRIEQDERQIHRHLNGTLVANTQKGFRAFFSHRGIRAVPDNTEVEQQDKAPWSWQYRLHSISRGENKDANITLLKQPKPTFDGQHVTFTHKQGIVETWENRAEGIEQTITIQRRPKCHVAEAHQGACTMDKSTRVVLAGVHHSGLEVASSGKKSIQWKLTDHNKPGMLAYQGLVVNDAKGRQLPSGIDYTPGALNLWYDDADAVYPVVVDPLLITLGWASTGDNQTVSFFGASVATAGDVNGDGYSDVIVGAPNFNSGTGKVYVYHGGQGGLSSNADWASVGDDQAGAQFGYSVATAGDVNGDGYSDVIVGAPGLNKAYVYLGGQGSQGELSISADWTSVGDGQAGVQFGISVATAGDVNGDGYSDVIVGAPGLGKAYVYLGGQASQSGLSNAESWASVGDGQAGVQFGISVATAGDVNGDGYSDVIVGAHQWSSIDAPTLREGRAYVYHGSVDGLSNGITNPPSADWAIDPTDQSLAYFGSSVASAGDINGDGYSDVIVGAHGKKQNGINLGIAYVYYGGSGGITNLNSLQLTGESLLSAFGYSVASAGDVNGDGYSDVIVGARLFNDNAGKAYIYLGSKSGLPQQADWEAIGDNQKGSYFGSHVASAGDVNGDGLSDVIIGAPWYDGSTSVDEGKAYLYYGAAAGLAPNATPNWEASPATHSMPSPVAQPNAEFGYSVASAGDVNGDGYSDVIVGAPNWDGLIIREGRVYVYYGSSLGLSPGGEPNWFADPTDQSSARFGQSVASAGDVNGDGYSDVIVGAPNWDTSPWIPREGRAYVYHGSPSGLSPGDSPNWQVDPTDQSSAYFGSSVASAGDVNGDGYSDVIIGAYSYDSPTSGILAGKAYVYYGNSGGLSQTQIDWESLGDDQAVAYYASSVASAGDVNGDGYSDVIVGAPYWDSTGPWIPSEGRAYVYYGSSGGLSTSTIQGPTTYSVVDPTNQSHARFGSSVASAGDVDGDGYSDVIVGALDWDGPSSAVLIGRAYVYHGSSSGLVPNATPDWEASPTNQRNTWFTNSVSSAGDINGDGYSDVIIGSPRWSKTISSYEGRVDVYYGSALGLSPGNTPDWTLEPINQTNAYFGFSVASAGDVNGDGYSDVIVGAHQYVSTLNYEGIAYVYHGNQGGGLSLNPRQARMDKSNLVQRNNATGTSSVRLQMRSRVSVGRTRARMVWEIKPRGVLFDGTNLSFGTWQDTTLFGAPVSELVTGLTLRMHYHWRARMQFFPQLNYGPWVSMGPNGKNEADFQAGATVTSIPCIPSGLDDNNCNSIDDDCVNGVDDQYTNDTSCFKPGACAAGNVASSCIGGNETLCQTGTPSITAESICNGVDDDCQNGVDDLYINDTSCFKPGVCAVGNVASSCIGGNETLCQTGTPTGIAESICNGDDDNCDGNIDEDVVGNACAPAPVVAATYATLINLPIAESTCGQYIASNQQTPVLLRFSVRMGSIGGTLQSIKISSANADPKTQLMCDLYADGNQNGAVDGSDRILGTVGLRQGGNITGLDVAMPALSDTHYIVQVHGALDAAAMINAPTDMRVATKMIVGCVLLLVFIVVLLLLRQNFILMHPMKRLASVLLFASVVVSAACVGRSGFEYAMGNTQLAIVSNTDVVIAPSVGNEIVVRGAPIEGVVFATVQ